MKKKIIIVLGMLTVAILCVLLLKQTVFNNTKVFVGSDGEPVIVRGLAETNSRNKSEEPPPHIGDIFENENGEDEVVFAINEDGSFVTVSLEMYNRLIDHESNE